jgi:hypothetical protein
MACPLSLFKNILGDKFVSYDESCDVDSSNFYPYHSRMF